MDNILTIKDLACGYPKKFMLQNICTSIKQGSFTGIIGPNGAGKTTLFKAITGETKIKNGEIYFKNNNLKNLSIKNRAQKIAIVTQQTDASDIKVEDYVLLGRLPYKKPFQLFESEFDYELANKYMKLTQIHKHKNKLMSELSGGEQQLAAIARALTQQPELLLLDEPTSHLDISHQVEILNLIQQLNDELGLTIIMIIHDLNMAGEFCSNLIMIDNGKIETEGTPKEVLTYKNIEKVYKTLVVTKENPLSKKPVIFVVSDKVLKTQRND